MGNRKSADSEVSRGSNALTTMVAIKPCGGRQRWDHHRSASDGPVRQDDPALCSGPIATVVRLRAAGVADR
jgi:hypothetical protein